MTGPSSRAQVNIRLDPEDADVLAAMAFLRDSSGAEILRPVVHEFLERQRDDPAVEAALAVRRQHRQTAATD